MILILIRQDRYENDDPKILIEFFYIFNIKIFTSLKTLQIVNSLTYVYKGCAGVIISFQLKCVSFSDKSV